MAPMSPRRRSRDDFEDDSGEDASSQGAGKRARRSNTAGAVTMQDRGYDLTPGALERETLRSKPTRKQHLPGSIVRVRLTDFVTYSVVEFFPGPSLNMVIGPNGTGKSTLVCAICLGLGWGPQHLGRAKEVSEFVKHGSSEAHIEIELAKDGRRFKRNIVIGCTIKREGNKSTYSINGKTSGKKVVQELARSLSIQVDNLCQFLPQDKVVEFAAMTPVELLRSTQRAVASQEMIEMHEQLKEYRKTQKLLDAKVVADQDTLTNLEGRQRLQEADVERMRERQAVVKRVEMLSIARPTAVYRDSKDRWQAAKEHKRVVAAELDTLEKDVEPALRAVNAKERYMVQIRKVVDDRTSATKNAERNVDRIGQQFEQLANESDSAANQIEKEKVAGRDKRKDITKIENMIKDGKLLLENSPPAFDVAAFNEKIRAKQRLWEAAEEESRRVREEIAEIVEQGRSKNTEIHRAEANITELDSQAGKQTVKLQKMSLETAKLWQWVQEHKDVFEKPVYGPPIVECSIRDPRIVSSIECLFQRTLFLSFTVQTKNDFTKLSNVAHDELKLSDVQIKTISVDRSVFPTPNLSAADMARYGLEGWAIDYINGPEPVLAMLCADIRAQEIGICPRDTTEEQYKSLSNSQIAAWVTPKSFYRTTRRREYGEGAVSTSVRNVRPASIWTDQPVDASVKRDLYEKTKALRAEVHAFDQQVSKLKERYLEQKDIYTTSKEDSKRLVTEKTALQNSAGQFKALPAKLADYARKVEEHQGRLNNIQERIRNHNAAIDGIAMSRAETAIKYADAVEALRVAHNTLHEAEIMYIEAKSDTMILRAKNSSIKEQLESKRKEVSDLIEEVDRHHKRSKALLNEIKRLFSREDEGEIRAFIATLPPEQTIEDLDSEIESEKARLELMHEGSSDTIRVFEARKREIDKLTARLGEFRTALEELNSTIASVRSQWEPELDRLISKISASFSDNMKQISCAGEVGIHKDEDFELWAIQIRVKFREHEPLNTLTSHRQSGGERAVSTIFYLMSLQSLTPSPFRVVDEINQGMDPRNERLVHRRMVEIACGVRDVSNDAESQDDDATQNKGGSQYFLITPKLLPDLAYARGMQVMCIASGEYMPADQARVDFRQCVQQMRALKTGVDGPLGAIQTGMAADVAASERSASIASAA